MSFTGVGIALVVIGMLVAWGNAGFPPRGFGSFQRLLAEYHLTKSKGETPSLDAQGAYEAMISYRIGGSAAVIGIAILVVGYFF